MPDPIYQNRQSTEEVGRHYHSGELYSIVSGSRKLEHRDLYLGHEGHYGFPNFPPDRNCGGAFRCLSRKANIGWVSVGDIWRGGAHNSSYVGSMAASMGLPGYGDDVFLLPDSYGAEAYDRMKPTKPDFSVLNYLFELKDVPSMLRARHEKLSDIGSYYLALKFGWEPLLRDLRNLFTFQQRAQKHLAQLIRDNGRSVRRRVNLFDRELSSTQNSGSSYGVIAPIVDTWFFQEEPKFTDKVVEYDRCWASGRFKYHLPPGPRDVNWNRRMVGRLFGATPSPAVLWNAIPYSWLIDWFTNAGHVISNMDAGVADRLAADYCYIMREYGLRTSREVEFVVARKSGQKIRMTSTSLGTTRYMTRVPGSPFGFNISEESLTGMQLSILGALGLSKLR